MSVELPLTVVERGGGGLRAYVAELARFRDAFYFMVRRDIKVRYAQTVLGFGWAVLQPFTQMIVFSVFFGGVAGLSSGGVPYPMFSIAAVVPWTYFSNAATSGSSSLIGNVAILSRIYFPRLLVPLTPVGAGLLDFGIGIGLLIGVMGAYGRTPPATAFLVLPLLMLAAALAALALIVWLSPLGVQYRDVRYVAPFFLQMFMFITPVIYTPSTVPSAIRPFYAVNPMVGVVNGFRSAFLGIGSMPWGALGLSYAVSSILIATGLLYFRRVERVFADIA
jgi:homopolymeric O-antigen transport system permease protein